MQQTKHTVNMFDNLLCSVCTRIQGPVLLLAQHSSHQPSSGLVSVSSEPGEYRVGVRGCMREEEKEKRKREGVLEGGGGCLHGQMDCSFSTHVEPCFVFHCRQAGAESVALLARATLFVLHTSLFSTPHTHTAAAHKHLRLSLHTC